MCDKANYYKKKWKGMKTAKSYNNVSYQNKADNYNLDIGRNVDIPYYGWRLFFPDKEYKTNSAITKQIKAVEAFIERHEVLSSLFTMANLEAGMSFDIDICELYEDSEFMKQWPNFKHEIHENPINILNCIKLGIHQKILKTVPEENLQYVLNSISSLPTIKLSILNYQPIICLRDLKLNYYERLVSTRGCVIRVGRIKHLIQWMVFGCTKCHLQKLIKQSQEIYTLPKKCDTCGTSKFYPVLDSPFVKSILFQIIRIQEPLNDEQIENKGKVPKVLDVELMDNLVNICMPGDDITLTGIIKVQGVDDASKIQVGTPFSLYMKAITVINNKRKCQNKSCMNNEISLKNYLAIQNIYKEPNIFALLVHSLCPSIYGHEMIKAGLILSLFGGNIKRAQLRDGIHILLIGDPGLGKSQMLQACARISTKGVYICGNSSTSSGLTVTLTKETGSNDFALEPGALVLADQGCCCIDEFDKICSQHQALLESMEQQSVTVAKSGIISSFPARTSILAAANPIGGQYDKSKTITENLNINQPILSRFDLIFLLLDKPDKHFDNLLCKHIMTVHTNSHTNFNQEAIDSSVNDCSLRKKLMLPLSTEIIPQPVLRTYISYARQYVKPKLSAKAAAVLQSYYLELRLKSKQFGSIPIFNRQLEAMIRLTEARAKLELRTEATESDALDVIDILRYTMIDTSEDYITSNLNSGGKLTNKKIKMFIKILEEKVNVDKKLIFSTKELKALIMCKDILINDFSVLISRLNEEEAKMPCDGKNPNCDRRRELLAQLKCLISSMDKKKPCEWDEPSCPPMVYCPVELSSCSQPYGCVKLCKSFDFRSSIRYKCECIKRNGLQDRCMMWDCMGRPECMTKLYPVCEPGRAALLKLTDLGDAEVALRKFYCADQAREAALATYCKLTCDKDRQRQILSCNNEAFYQSSKPCARSDSLNDNDNDSWCQPFCDTSSYQVCVPSVYPNYMFKSCDICCPSRKLEESYFSYNSPLLMCSSS